MDNSKNTLKYFAYVRKSTEGDERQAVSIESQKNKIKELFPHLNVIATYEEKHSAFKIDNRPAFTEMIAQIKKGVADGIIAWHPDRLSRNEIDAATITHLIRTNFIKDLKFGSYTFDNSPEGIMMLQLSLSQSQYYSSKLGKDVKRGLQNKINMGWRPGQAPEGYANDFTQLKGLREIIVDKKRFEIIRKGFDLFLSGAYTATEVLNIVNNEYGYRTRKRGRGGNKPLSRSSWYKILANPFYAGVVVYNGIESKGKHKPMITINEYNRVQELLGVKGAKRRPKERNFDLIGSFKCGVCGCSITAENKSKFIKSKNVTNDYVYYHCTHKKKEAACREKSIEEKELISQITTKLKKLEMHPLFLEWALDYLDSQKDKEQKNEKIIKDNIQNQINDVEKQISALTSMRIRDLLDDDEFLKEKSKLKSQIASLKLKKENKPSEEELIKLTKENFKFSAYALKEYCEGDKNTKRTILSKLGSNHVIMQKNTHFSAHKWLLPLFENVEEFNAELERLEPLNIRLDKRKNEALTSLNLRWLAFVDDLRQLDWGTAFEFPEVAYADMVRLTAV